MNFKIFYNIYNKIHKGWNQMLTNFDYKILNYAVQLSKNCPLSKKSYSVGAVITDNNQNIISTGFSREYANKHAEEIAILKAVKLKLNLIGTIIYSTMEPCGLRLSGKKSCSDLIIDSKIKRVVYGIKEPFFLVDEPSGLDKLKNNNIIIDEIPEYNNEIIKINNHIY
jgi:pyrimidine deaminase RibD-like protein